MIQFITTIKRFDQQGEKTGWTYIEIPYSIADQLKPGCKKSFRVSGQLDNYVIERVALMPMGNGHFIMALNAAMRKGMGKAKGASVTVQLQLDEREIKPPADFITCLQDEPDALHYYTSLPKSHQLYFTRWIESAKTEATRINRIAKAVSALVKKRGFGEMLRAMREYKQEG